MMPSQRDGNLSPKELRVARLVAIGLHNKAIATELNTSEGTIKTQLYRVFKKLRIGHKTNARVMLARLVWEQLPGAECEYCQYRGFVRFANVMSGQVLFSETLEGNAISKAET